MATTKYEVTYIIKPDVDEESKKVVGLGVGNTGAEVTLCHNVGIGRVGVEFHRRQFRGGRFVAGRSGCVVLAACQGRQARGEHTHY